MITPLSAEVLKHLKAQAEQADLMVQTHWKYGRTILGFAEDEYMERGYILANSAIIAWESYNENKDYADKYHYEKSQQYYAERERQRTIHKRLDQYDTNKGVIGEQLNLF